MNPVWMVKTRMQLERKYVNAVDFHPALLSTGNLHEGMTHICMRHLSCGPFACDVIHPQIL